MTVTTGAVVFATPYTGSDADNANPQLEAGPNWADYWLSPSTYRYRTPTFLTVAGANLVTGRGDTQAQFDTHLFKARYGSGLDYFIHNIGTERLGWTAPGIGYQPTSIGYIGWDAYVAGTTGFLDLHLSSPYKSLVKICVNLCGSTPLLPSPGDSTSFATYLVPRLLTLFSDPDYMLVLTNRPLVYLFAPVAAAAEWPGANTAAKRANCKTDLDALRAACLAAGLGNPYIVGINGAEDLSTIKTDIGLDAAGMYSYVDSITTGMSFNTYKTAVEARWAQQATWYGTANVPSAVLGFSRQPISDQGGRDRNGNNTLYQIEGFGNPGPYSAMPTTAQWVAHWQACEAFAEAGSAAKTMLVQAWLELDCAGCYHPDYVDYGTRNQAIALLRNRQRDNHGALRDRGIAVATP